jgi:acetolactate synthase I/II/III large subunit
MRPVSGAEVIVGALERLGVEVVFGVPGGAILPAYDPIRDSVIRHVLARHEQGAGHMAEGYALATGRTGVVLATSGPGATNLVTPLMNARLDSTPFVAITGQVASHVIGTQAFQEAPTTELTRHCTKANWLVTDPGQLAETLYEAFAVAQSGRPGPVLVDVPKDVQVATTTHFPQPPAGERRSSEIDRAALAKALVMLEQTERPVLYVGGGAVDACAEVRDLAEATRTPVVTTLMGRGVIPDDHPLALGMPGMHGLYTATTAMQRADLLVAVGVRFDDRVTGDPGSFAPGARVIHIDIDPAELGKIRTPEVGIVGDAASALGALLAAWGDRPVPDRVEWLATLAEWQHTHPLRYESKPDGPIKPQYVIDALHKVTEGRAVVTSGVGQHQMWASQRWRFSRSRDWINSGGLGTMGFAVPSAIGAKVGRPDETVFAIDGDGSFQMTMQELITASQEGVGIKVALLNNGHYGMVKQWQELFYGGRLSAVQVGGSIPDYVGLAESLGCVSFRVDRPEAVIPTIEKSMTVDDRPVVIDFVVDPDEMVWPMVIGGGCNDEVLMGPEDLEATAQSSGSL